MLFCFLYLIHSVHGLQIPIKELFHGLIRACERQDSADKSADPGQHLVGVKHVNLIGKSIRCGSPDDATFPLAPQTVQDIGLGPFPDMERQLHMFDAPSAAFTVKVPVVQSMEGCAVRRLAGCAWRGGALKRH